VPKDVRGGPEELLLEAGRRVRFQSHDGKAKLTGTVREAGGNEVVLQCGRVIIPVLREKGTFSEAPEPDRTETVDYAKERARRQDGSELEHRHSGLFR
jgi:hypothetical protein